MRDSWTSSEITFFFRNFSRVLGIIPEINLSVAKRASFVSLNFLKALSWTLKIKWLYFVRVHFWGRIRVLESFNDILGLFELALIKNFEKSVASWCLKQKKHYQRIILIDWNKISRTQKYWQLTCFFILSKNQKIGNDFSLIWDLLGERNSFSLRNWKSSLWYIRSHQIKFSLKESLRIVWIIFFVEFCGELSWIFMIENKVYYGAHENLIEVEKKIIKNLFC